MTPTFSQTGGARLDYFNATIPFAVLSANADAVRLTCFGSEYLFPRACIRSLRRHRGFFSTGLRIEHSVALYPKFVVFWASVFFSTGPYRALKTKLEKLGYEVHE